MNVHKTITLTFIFLAESPSKIPSKYIMCIMKVLRSLTGNVKGPVSVRDKGRMYQIVVTSQKFLSYIIFLTCTLSDNKTCCHII